MEKEYIFNHYSLWRIYLLIFISMFASIAIGISSDRFISINEYPVAVTIGWILLFCFMTFSSIMILAKSVYRITISPDTIQIKCTKGYPASFSRPSYVFSLEDIKKYQDDRASGYQFIRIWLKSGKKIRLVHCTFDKKDNTNEIITHLYLLIQNHNANIKTERIIERIMS